VNINDFIVEEAALSLFGELSYAIDTGARVVFTGAEAVIAEAQRRVDQPATLEDNDHFDRAVAIAAVAETLNRHAGRLEQSPLAPDTWFQIGKDLREANVVIASGGVFAARADAEELLALALSEARKQGKLIPGDGAKRLIDRDYVMFVVGLLAKAWPGGGGCIGKGELAAGREGTGGPPEQR